MGLAQVVTWRPLKYLIAGGTGLAVNLGVLHILVVFGLYYLAASAMAVSVSTVVGFLLQKFWTFESHSRDRMHTQFLLYAGLALCNIAFNTALVFAFVEWVGAHYLIAQTVAAGLVAVWSFFIYQGHIFSDGVVDL